jgi:hypothetical protein
MRERLGDLSDGATPPTSGNYVGGSYTPGQGCALDGAELGESAFEAQTSHLAAKRGKLLLDYLRATVPDEPGVWRDLAGWLGSKVARPFGWRGWYDESAMVLDGGLVAWCSDKERAKTQGILIDLPGKACASLGERLVPFMAWCLAVGRITRADYALDDFGQRITLERVLDAEASGALVMRWQGLTLIQKRKRGQICGWTCYLGSRQSQAMVRIYDKASEQNKPGAWVRFELETKSDLADRLAREYFSAGASAILGQVHRRLRFTDPVPGDSNTRRWPVAEWWREFIGEIEPGPSLTVGEVPNCTISALAAFIERQAGPALATVLKADGGDLARLFGIFERSEYRLKPKHLAALNLLARRLFVGPIIL